MSKRKIDIEIIVGLFIFIGLLCMGYTSIKLGQIDFFNNDTYKVKTIFTTVRGLKENTNVEISGVKIGTVDEIKLENYAAIVNMSIDNDVEIQDDAIASIKTKGILGEKYIEISPGGSDIIIEEGGVLFDTEPPLDLESLIKNFIMGD